MATNKGKTTNLYSFCTWIRDLICHFFLGPLRIRNVLGICWYCPDPDPRTAAEIEGKENTLRLFASTQADTVSITRCRNRPPRRSNKLPNFSLIAKKLKNIWEI
jgi:hypothetical protein